MTFQQSDENQNLQNGILTSLQGINESLASLAQSLGVGGLLFNNIAELTAVASSLADTLKTLQDMDASLGYITSGLQDISNQIERISIN